MEKKKEFYQEIHITAEVKENLKVLRQIKTQFDKVGLTSSTEIERVLVDLADIYSESKAYIKLIESLKVKKDMTKDHMASSLIKIEIMLFSHIYWHMKNLSKSLDRIIGRLHNEKRVDNDIKKIYGFK